MVRLWHRVGTFRALAVLVLVAGLVGGLVIADRQTQRNASADPARAADAVALLKEPATSSASPSTSVQAQAQAKAQDAAAAAAAQAKAAEDEARRKQEEASRSDNRSSGPPSGGSVGPIPASCNVYTGHQATGCAILLQYGFGLDQMPCLVKLWNKESRWNPKAKNNSSGAYGIPQALPGKKMASVGADWQTNPVTQIKWGLNYIKGRYKTPCNAWSHSQSTGWY